MWEEFRETIQLPVGAKEILANCLAAQEGKAEPIHMVFSVKGELLTSTESIVQHSKEYFKVLLNLTNTNSEEKASQEICPKEAFSISTKQML